jgi:hypothetical protein
MKKYIVSLLLIVISCKVKPLVNSSLETKNKPNYNVYKIDSIDNYYLIYAKKNESIYKIISKKQRFYNCNKILINSNYDFDLIPVKMDPRRVGDTLRVRPFIHPNSLLCYTFDSKTEICVERYMSDLHFANNVKGLCFIKE